MDENKKEQLVYTAEEVSKLLQTNRAKIYALINKGLLRTTKIGRRKITKEALLSFLSLVDGIDVDAVMEQIPDGLTLNDLAQEGAFGDKAKKSGPTNADLKRFLSKGPLPKGDRVVSSSPTASGRKNVSVLMPSFIAERQSDRLGLSEAEKKRIREKAKKSDAP